MRILIADDDRLTQRILATNLYQWGHTPVICGDGDEAWKALQNQNPPSLVILDWEMPGKSGIDLCRLIRKEIKEPYIYIVLLTAKTSQEDLIQGLEAGADDYMSKPFHPQELRVRIAIGERIMKLQDQLREQALCDSLTGLWNHRAILDVLKREISRALREKTLVGILLADLDHFKKINDTYGHPAGDMVLIELAQRLKSAVRPYDAIGRYGGEEFLMILSNCSKDTFENVAKRFCVLISRTPFVAADTKITVTISIGATLRGFLTNHETHAIIQTADNALYEAKHTGRNRVVVQLG